MSSQQQKQPILKKITKGLTVGSVITGSTFFHGPPVLALGLTKLFKKSKKVDETNINRQLPALQSTIGKAKADIMEQRLLDINPELQLAKRNEFLNPENMEEILESEKFDYVLDCIDSVTPKITLIKTARRKKIKIISCMGAGGKIDPSKVMVRDISKTHNCFLAKQVRKRLKKDNIHKGFRCVFSNEIQNEESLKMTDGTNFKKSFYGTISFIPAIFGLYAAAEVINYLIKKSDEGSPKSEED